MPSASSAWFFSLAVVSLPKAVFPTLPFGSRRVNLKKKSSVSLARCSLLPMSFQMLLVPSCLSQHFSSCAQWNETLGVLPQFSGLHP